MYYVDDGVYGSFHLCMVGPYIGNKLIPTALLRPRQKVSKVTVEPGPSDDLTREVGEGEPSVVNDGELEMRLATIWGPTCDSLDCLGTGITLPLLEAGDWLYYKNTGAFSAANGTSFNSISPPTPHYIWT